MPLEQKRHEFRMTFIMKDKICAMKRTAIKRIMIETGIIAVSTNKGFV